jgi:hypothetical protein
MLLQLTRAEDDARAKDEQVESMRQQITSMEDSIREKDDEVAQAKHELSARDTEVTLAWQFILN